MKSVIDNPNVKIKCQIFTPQNIAKRLLNIADYKVGRKLQGKKILENSCGNGNILVEIVDRYIRNCLRNGYSFVDIVKGIEKDIYAIELDNEKIEECKSRLEDLRKHYGIPKVNWNLYNVDALSFEYTSSFDFIIGNPPYISYRELDVNQRKWIKEHFVTCSDGKFDYCYAFIEKAVNLLTSNGKIIQLIPNNIYKNVFGKKLRDLLAPHIENIYVYPDTMLFEQSLSSSSIFKYENGNNTSNFVYKDESQNIELVLPRTNLENDKWIFSDNKGKKSDVKFGDKFVVANSIATLCNDAFLLEEPRDIEKMEKEIIRPATSPKAKRFKKNNYIIFPYKFDSDGKLVKIEESIFKQMYPQVTNHLKKYRTRLKDRKIEGNTKWFEYGRSQAITQMNKPKLMLSTVVSKKVEIYEIDKETIPYTGIVIVTRDDSSLLSEARKILESSEFLKYVKEIGTYVNGGSIRITCKDISNYLI